MKKILVSVVFVFIFVFCIAAKSDPFATKRFINNEIEISFRTEDSAGRPQVYYRFGSSKQQCYYNYDDEYIVFFDENNNPIEVYGYSFINGGTGLRLFDENGRFFDLESDNGKTVGDKVWESVDVVFQNFLIYGGSGATIGACCGGPVGAAIGLAVGGVFGVGKAFAHNIFGWV